MKDGRRLSRVDHLVCRGGDNPMSTEELFEKFEDCAGASCPRQVAPLFERLETLEKASSIRDVMRLLEVLTRHAPHAATAPVRFAKASEQEAVETTWVP